jgi:hypothetical protein
LLDEVIEILGWFADWRSDLATREADLEVTPFSPENSVGIP